MQSRTTRRASSMAAIAVGLASAFLMGRASGPDPGNAAQSRAPYVARAGSIVSVPGAALRCTVSQEAGLPNFSCMHVPGGHHDVVFFKRSILVYAGDPENPVWATQRP